MNYNFKDICIVFLCLLFTEIFCINFNNQYMPNFLLIFLTYLLYENYHLYQCIAIIFNIEFISLLQTGTSGICSIILIPLALQFSNIKKLLHIKILTPCIFIFIYELLYETIRFLLISDKFYTFHICIKTIINCAIFLIIYYFIQTLFNKNK